MSVPLLNPVHPDNPLIQVPISNAEHPVNWASYDPNPVFLNTNPMEKLKPEHPDNTDIPNILTIMTSRFLIQSILKILTTWTLG